MPDGKEVAGAGTSCGRILSQTVVQTGAPGSVAAAQLVVKAGQTSPERDVTDEPRLPPPAEEWGAGKCHSLGQCACHQNHQNPPLPVATHEMRRLELSATWRRHWLMLQDGRDASCRPGCLSIPVIIVGEYAACCPHCKPMGMHHDNSINAAADLFYTTRDLFRNDGRMHFRLSQGHL